MMTLQHLMQKLNMMYHFEKLKVEFDKSPLNGVDYMQMILKRTLSTYDLVAQFMEVFDLITLKDTPSAPFTVEDNFVFGKKLYTMITALMKSISTAGAASQL